MSKDYTLTSDAPGPDADLSDEFYATVRRLDLERRAMESGRTLSEQRRFDYMPTGKEKFVPLTQEDLDTPFLPANKARKRKPRLRNVYLLHVVGEDGLMGDSKIINRGAKRAMEKQRDEILDRGEDAWVTVTKEYPS